MHTKPKERNEAFGQDHLRHQQGRIDHHNAQKVGHDVSENDLPCGHTNGHGRFHILSVFNRQGLTAHNPAHVQPSGQADANKDHGDRATGHNQQQNQHKHVGDRHKDIDQTHHNAVDTSADKPSGGPINGADDHRHKGANDAHSQRDPRALDNAVVKVTSVFIKAKEVAIFN